MSHIKEDVDKIKTHNLCSITFLRKSRRYEVMWRRSRAGVATDDNMAHAHCMLDN